MNTGYKFFGNTMKVSAPSLLMSELTVFHTHRARKFMVYFHNKFRISNSNSPTAITIKPKGKPSRGRHNVQKKKYLNKRCILSRTITRNLRRTDSVVGIATGLRESPYGQIFSVLQNVQTGCGARPISHSMSSGVLYRV
jgi:hypothetical protein